MKKFLIAMVCLVGLSACTQDDAFVVACSTVPTIDSAFQVWVSTGKVSAKVIKDERVAIQAAQAACNGPRPSDTKTAIAYVQRIVTQLLQSLATAKQQAGA